MGQQKDSNGKVVPLDNGPYSIVEPDNAGIVNITDVDSGGPAGPYTDGGNDNLLAAGSGAGYAGHNITVQCVKLGTTTITTQLGASSPAAGPVTGFN
jgi:hypothetical protein